MVREVGLGMHTVRGLLTRTFWQSLVGTVSQISCFFSVHSCLGTILQTGVEISVHFLVGKGKHVSLWTIPAIQKIDINKVYGHISDLDPTVSFCPFTALFFNGNFDKIIILQKVKIIWNLILMLPMHNCSLISLAFLHEP